LENGGRRKEEGGRRKKEGGRRKEEGGRRKEEGGRRKKEGGRRRKEEEGGGLTFYFGALSSLSHPLPSSYSLPSLIALALPSDNHLLSQYTQ
jgi:ATP-dependent RNA helicase DHX57